ncbi:MAG: YtxH domain-containing protein [bacterium]
MKAPPRSPAILPEHETDWQQVAVFGAGLALGLMLGAGVALLTAPHAGEETRSILQRKARRTSRALGRHGTDAWLDFRNELHAVTRAISRRNARRLAVRDLERESDSQMG